jgi:hypothetical protein
MPNENLPSADHDLLIRIETKVDSFLAASSDHEVRLRGVEADREQLQGSIRALKAVAGALGLFVAAFGALAAWAALN